MLEKWDKPVVESNHPGAARKGASPDDVPRDGQWYVMRTETIERTAELKDKKNTALKVSAAARYIRTRIDSGVWDGFEVAKVREDDDNMLSWHMLGRWT